MGDAFGNLFRASTKSGVPLIEDVLPFPFGTVFFVLFFPIIMTIVAVIVGAFCLIREVLWCRKERKQIISLKKREKELIEEVYIKQQKMLDDESGIFNPDAIVENRENAIDYIMLEEKEKAYDRHEQRFRKKKIKKKERSKVVDNSASGFFQSGYTSYLGSSPSGVSVLSSSASGYSLLGSSASKYSMLGSSSSVFSTSGYFSSVPSGYAARSSSSSPSSAAAAAASSSSSTNDDDSERNNDSDDEKKAKIKRKKREGAKTKKKKKSKGLEEE